MTKSHNEDRVKTETRTTTEYVPGVGIAKVTRRFTVVNADDWIEEMTARENGYFIENARKYELLLKRDR
jgi:hypothetical protein